MRFYMSLASSAKYTLLAIIMLIFNSTITFAGCGSCQTDHHMPNVSASNIEKSNALISDGFEHYISKIKQVNEYVIKNNATFIHFLQPSLF